MAKPCLSGLAAWLERVNWSGTLERAALCKGKLPLPKARSGLIPLAHSQEPRSHQLLSQVAHLLQPWIPSGSPGAPECNCEEGWAEGLSAQRAGEETKWLPGGDQGATDRLGCWAVPTPASSGAEEGGCWLDWEGSWWP